ncbi:hypothetical protein L484_008971 [Morus notabilis]|uniref:Uncharacterized protein n=1 Tax=Morus notabilis TaxID=981085 RepID=W9SAW4_9ROSA|nr:hypothetical protein L484_008971 [Morus notabilis]
MSHCDVPGYTASRTPHGNCFSVDHTSSDPPSDGVKSDSTVEIGSPLGSLGLLNFFLGCIYIPPYHSSSVTRFSERCYSAGFPSEVFVSGPLLSCTLSVCCSSSSPTSGLQNWSRCKEGEMYLLGAAGHEPEVEPVRLGPFGLGYNGLRPSNSVLGSSDLWRSPFFFVHSHGCKARVSGPRLWGLWSEHTLHFVSHYTFDPSTTRI